MRQNAAYLIAVLMLLASSAASSNFSVPGDLDGDNLVSAEELTAAMESYENQTITSETYEEIRHIHDNYPIKITDSAGQETTIYKPLKRAVVFNSETVEVMRSINCEDNLVGVGKYTVEDKDFFPEMAELANVGSVWTPDCEAVLSLNPDVVFLYATFQNASAEEIKGTIESAGQGIIVVRLDCFKPDSYVREVRTLGKIFEHDAEAESYLDFYDRAVRPVQALEDEEIKPRVYLESWTDYKSCGPASGWGQKLEMAGGVNVFSDSSVEYPLVDPEAVLERDPDVVIKLCGAGNLTFGGYGGDDGQQMKGLMESLLDRPGWDRLTSAQNDRIFIMSNDILGGAQYFIGTLYMAKLLYPEQLKDLDPEEIHREYLTVFQGLDEDLFGQGAFVYPSEDSSNERGRA